MGACSKEKHLFMNQLLQESDLSKDLRMSPRYNYMHVNSWKEEGKCSGQNTVKQKSFLEFFDHFK